jgi:DNA-binding response OmpR family regulator
VLVADDDPAILHLLRLTLPDTRIQLMEAADGVEAWALLQAQRPSVAILDVKMPGLSGLELTRAIRAEPTLAATRVILLAAGASPEQIAAGMDSGADRYITKPFSPLELLAALD